ncbi:hypothetical protein VHEMI07216 [[Torrubiella] hemipterigena]|uniref:Protein kinase domain-containing protein n=1 Tax=[Torrubiella] hemipterigena TaxID=1531966 RepID=A0A0A1TL84_9HYPO|nr:hypothetical protein VHEMI07216 [[Torrubiella] hemipterigena]
MRSVCCRHLPRPAIINMSAKEVEELRRLIAVAEARVEAEQHLREEEQRRREAAEELARESLPQTLEQYLEATHQLDLSIQVVTDPSSTTKGDTTNPTSRIFPRRIVPWLDFATEQRRIWESLSVSPQFCSEAAFPSQHQLAYVQSILQPISSELGLRNFQREVVENAVQKLVERAYEDPVLRTSLDLQGTVTFKSHTNLGTPDDALSQSMEQVSISESVSREGPSISRTKRQQKTRRRARGKGNRADQFCIYRKSDARNEPTLAIEYKAPHKATMDEIVAGLESEVQPEQDVIHQDLDSFSSTSRALAAAIVTQLFSYMVGKGIRYGYFCTGQIFGFLRIEDDPSVVQVALCVPALDVVNNDENRLHLTATAQVFAFLLQAIATEPPPESWHDEVDKLDTWAVEYDDILSKIPPSATKSKERRVSLYKPQKWAGFHRSPIQTRSRCNPSGPAVAHSESDDNPPSPTPGAGITAAQQPTSAGTVSSNEKNKGGKGKQSNQGIQRQRNRHATTAVNIKDRLYCTHKCLRGLAKEGPLDPACPNVHSHGQRHIRLAEFLHLIRTQLHMDRGRNADCECLCLAGLRGVLFKVRLTSHGYTMVAKGMESFDQHFLHHEKKVYDVLSPVQGRYVPVCVGFVDLVLPYHFDGGVYTQFLFLSWAGQSMPKSVPSNGAASIMNGVSVAMKAIHRLRVLHGDAAWHNILLDANKRIMVIDFERSQLRNQRPLRQISMNLPGRKRRNSIKDEFTRELRAALSSLESRFSISQAGACMKST